MADDGLDRMREIADAAEKVMGDGAHLFEHHCRNGDWLFIGATAAALASSLLHVGPGPIVVGGLVLGFVVNRTEAKQIIARLRGR